MAEDPELVISTFLDGEPVDSATVLAALDTETGRAALVDFMRLRVLASADGAVPGPDFYARVRDVAPVIRRRRQSRVLAWLAPAAVAASLLVGFWAGLTFISRRPETAPPKPARIVEFHPGVDWQIPSERPQ